MRTLPRPLLAVAVPLALILGACSGGGASTAPSVAASAEAPSQAPSAEAPSGAPAAATIGLAENALGQILVDAKGKTLYGFTVDADGVSACYDDCAAAWPPLLAEGDGTVGEGLDAAMLTTVDRTDGTKQLKYGDWPLYYFAADAAAGAATGQGLNDVWFVIGADGALIGQS